jgi:cytochrome P450
MEGVLALATMVRDWRFSLPPGAVEVELQPSVSLRPKHGVSVLVERRA